MSRQKKKRRKLRIPTALVDAGRDRLRMKLHRVFLDFYGGRTTKEQCLQQGFDAIDQNYQERLQKVKEYVERKKLSCPDLPEFELLKDRKANAEQRWRRIVNDV